jgi:anti-sigma factor RsiW
MDERLTIQDLRRYLDGELDPDAARLIERRLDGDEPARQFVEAERRLRDRVGRIMIDSAPAAPAALEQRIRTALAAESRDAAAPAAAPAVAGRIEPDLAAASAAAAAARPQRSVFEGPSRANIYAVAATLAIIAGAILFGIFGRSIDEQAAPPAVSDVVDSAEFVSAEHTRCATSDERQARKFQMTAQEQVAAEMAAYLGVAALPDIDLSALGYAFVGGGPCMVPHAIRSAHLMYRRDAAGENGLYPMISVFMVPDQGQFDANTPLSQAPGTWQSCDGAAMEHKVLCASDGQVAYFICCCLNEDLPRLAEALKEQIGRR